MAGFPGIGSAVTTHWLSGGTRVQNWCPIKPPSKFQNIKQTLCLHTSFSHCHTELLFATRLFTLTLPPLNCRKLPRSNSPSLLNGSILLNPSTSHLLGQNLETNALHLTLGRPNTTPAMVLAALQQKPVKSVCHRAGKKTPILRAHPPIPNHINC